MPATSAQEILTARQSTLDALEAESIEIFREAVAESEKPVMLYSLGKDSAVLLHLAHKAFAPGKLPFPLLHVDTTWKFQAMYAYRETIKEHYNATLLRHVNKEGVAKGINPFTHGSKIHTDTMKTQALRQILNQGHWDLAFGGARRDEERSRAKERVFSFRDAQMRWDPRRQRPEPWNLFNTHKKEGESFRVFPLSNWTEIDIWLYILREQIPVVPLYLAAERPVVKRQSTWIMVDDDRFVFEKGEKAEIRKVRFRTLGCYPLSGAVDSDATTLEQVVEEVITSRFSERQGRLIDFDGGSMEDKKKEGYF